MSTDPFSDAPDVGPTIDNIPEQAKLYVELIKKIKDIEAELKQLKSEKAYLEPILSESMQSAEMDAITIAGYTLSRKTARRASIAKDNRHLVRAAWQAAAADEQLAEFIDPSSLDGMLSIHAGQLAGIVKELAEAGLWDDYEASQPLRDIVTVYDQQQIGARKS